MRPETGSDTEDVEQEVAIDGVAESVRLVVSVLGPGPGDFPPEMQGRHTFPVKLVASVHIHEGGIWKWVMSNTYILLGVVEQPNGQASPRISCEWLHPEAGSDEADGGLQKTEIKIFFSVTDSDRCFLGFDFDAFANYSLDPGGNDWASLDVQARGYLRRALLKAKREWALGALEKLGGSRELSELLVYLDQRGEADLKEWILEEGMTAVFSGSKAGEMRTWLRSLGPEDKKLTVKLGFTARRRFLGDEEGL